MTAAELQMLAIAHPIAGIYAVVLFVRCIVQLGRWQQRQQEDRHYADVRAWRDVAAEETQALKPVQVVRRETLDVARIERAEAAGRAAEALVKAAQSTTAGRHRAKDPRDRRRYDWRRDTEVFEVIALAETGSRPKEHGPRESTVRRPIAWEQTELEVP